MEKTQRQISLEVELSKELKLLAEMKAERTMKANYFVNARYNEEKDLLRDLKESKKEIDKQESIIKSIQKDLKSFSSTV